MRLAEHAVKQAAGIIVVAERVVQKHHGRAHAAVQPAGASSVVADCPLQVEIPGNCTIWQSAHNKQIITLAEEKAVDLKQKMLKDVA